MFLIMMILILKNTIMNSKKSPNKLIFSVILMTMILSLSTSKLTKNSWMGFSLYLIMVGGLMILFTLMVSITPKKINNSNFSFPILLSILIPMLNKMEKTFNIKCPPNFTFNYKMNIIFMIIIMLNTMLMMTSKMLIAPMKPFRSCK